MKKLLILLVCLLGFTHFSSAGAQTLGEYAIQDSSLRNPCPSDLNGMVADWFRAQGLPYTGETGRVVSTNIRETVYESEVISVKLPYWNGLPFSLEIGVFDRIVPTRVVIYIPKNAVNASIGNQGDVLAEDVARASLIPFLRQRAKTYTQPCADSSAYVPTIGFDSQVKFPGQILADFTSLKACQNAVQELEIFAFAGVRYGELGGCNVLASTSGQGSSANVRQFEDAMRSLGYVKRLSYVTGAVGVTVQGWQLGDAAFIIELGAYQPDPRATLLVWRNASFKARGYAFDGRVSAPFDALFLGSNPACLSRQTQLRQALSPPEKSVYADDGGCLSMTGNTQQIYTQTRAALEQADYEISEDFTGYNQSADSALIYAARAGTNRGLQLVIQPQTDGVLMTYMDVTVNQAVTATRAPFAFDLSVRVNGPAYQLPSYCAENLQGLRDSIQLNSGSSYAPDGGCIIISALYTRVVPNTRQAFAAELYFEEFSQIADTSSFIEFQRGGSSDSFVLNVVPTTQHGAAETVILWVKVANAQAPKKSGSSAKPVPVGGSRASDLGSMLEFSLMTEIDNLTRGVGRSVTLINSWTATGDGDSRRRRTLH